MVVILLGLFFFGIFLKLYCFRCSSAGRLLLMDKTTQRKHKLSKSIVFLPKTSVLRYFKAQKFHQILAQNPACILSKRISRTAYPSLCSHRTNTSSDTPYASYHLCFDLRNTIFIKIIFGSLRSSSAVFQVPFLSQDSLLLPYNCELNFTLSYTDKAVEIH